MRLATIVLCILNAILWAVIAYYTLVGAADPATAGLEIAFGWIVTLLFVITTAPAIALASMQRAPKSSFALALAFPFGFAALLVFAIFYFAYIL